MKKLILPISLIFNMAFAILVVRHYILLPQVDPNAPISYFVCADVLYTGLPVSKNDIMLLGDSQFASFPAIELTGNINIRNRGIYYDQTRGLLNRTKDMVKGRPSKIFLLCGINDLENNIQIDTIACNFNQILRLIKKNSPETKVFVLSVLPTSKDFPGFESIEQRRTDLNKLYLASTKYNTATFIDLDKAFKKRGLTPAYDVGDGIHLNGAGYLKLAEVIRPYLKI